MSNGTLNIKSMNAYDSIAVKCQNGNIKAESVSTPSFNISCTNASLSAIDIKAKKFDCSTSNGTIDASGIVSDDIRLETSNGKITAMPLGTRDDYKLSDRRRSVPQDIGRQSGGETDERQNIKRRNRHSLRVICLESDKPLYPAFCVP